MTLDQPFPDLDELLVTMGVTGERLGGFNANKGAAAFNVPTTLV